MFLRLFFNAILLITVGAQAWADDANDGPGRGVARISVINGDVSVRRGDSGDLIAAAINSPLVVQDRVITGPTARTEVQFDFANMIRVSHNAEIRLAELEYKRYIVQVARGTVTFRVLRDQDADVEISTPSVSVRPVKRGTYRITVHEDGTSQITVRSGEAEIFTPKGSERLKSGRTMSARGTASDPEYQIASEIKDDEWDHWNQRRDKDLERSQSYSYVSPDIYGADDLDNHGRWVFAGSYGWVWSPRVVVGWAPYRYGRWSWIDYYGWSWISYDPWGWAPYHYGRWFYSAPYGWCWWPGAIHARHYWSPGLVAFVGFGSAGVGVGFGFGFGNVGWVPLAPYERYYPWYGRGYYGGYRSNTFVNNNVRVVNNVNITNIYRNSRVDSAVTVVDHDGFSRGRSGTAWRGNGGDFSRASVVQGALPLAPGRESLRMADREAAVRAPDGRVSDRFFSRRQPTAVDRVPFEDQRRSLEQATRRAFADEGQQTPGQRTEVPRAERTSVSTGENNRGWRQTGESTQRTADVPSTTGRTADRGQESRSNDSGWHRFGSPRTESQTESPARGDRAAQFGQPSNDTNRAQRSADSNSRGWRRVGEGTTRTPSQDTTTTTPRSTERPADRPTERNSDWRNFGSTGRTDFAGSQSAAPAARGDRTSDNWRRDMGGTRSERADSPRIERRSSPSGGGALRMSPPIVRERSVERQSFSGGGGGQRSAAAPSAAPRGGSEGGGSRGGGGGGQRGGGGESRGGGGRSR